MKPNISSCVVGAPRAPQLVRPLGAIAGATVGALLAALVVPLVVAPGALRAAEGPREGIWEAPLPREPFDVEPFRPVRIPAWLEETTAYGFGAEPRDAACGVQMAVVGVGGCEAVYYPSKILPRDPRVPQDMVKKAVEELHAAGFRVLAAIPPRLQADAYAKHPDWRSKGRRDEKLREVGPDFPLGGALCLMGPWGDTLIDVLAESMTLYPWISGYSFDGIHTSGVCYCDHCVADFRKETGGEIPDVNMNDLAFRRYQCWLDRRMEGFVRKMQERLKAQNPEFALVTWTTNAGRFGHFLDIPRNMSARMNLLFDSPGQEFWLDETNRGNTIVPAFANAYIWAVTNWRHAHSEPYIMTHGNPYGTDSFPAQEMLRRVLLTITYGPQAALSFGWPGLRDAACSAFREVERRRQWLTHTESEPWAALLMSDDTRTFYGREPGKVEERYLANVLGTFRATLEAHLPVTVVNDWNLTPADLSRYRVLVLPNAACLGVEAADAVRRYVEGGGGLVASVDASLFDELGEPRGDFLLADVLGVHYRGAVEAGGGKAEDIDVNFAKGIGAGYWEKRKNIFDFKPERHPIFDDPRLREYLGDRPVTFKGQAVAVKEDAGVEVAATITAREPGSKPFPAVIARTFGKGRVVYLACGLDGAYYLYPYPYHRLALDRAIRWAAGQPPRISVEAPMCVHSTFFRQRKDGERLVVHLYSDLNTTAGHAKPDEDVPLREEIVPVEGIRVSFEGYPIARVHLEPGGTELPVKESEGRQSVKVPRLEIHAMVVAELRPQ